MARPYGVLGLLIAALASALFFSGPHGLPMIPAHHWPPPHRAGATASGPAPPPSSSQPIRLTIPALDVSAPVVPLGLEPDGTVAVPPIEPDAPVGWYDGSSAPGRAGASVLLGHSTVGRFGDGVFRHLGRLKPGVRITVGRADGTTVTFTVRMVRQYLKKDFPAAEVYSTSGPPRLNLVTCGGPRDGRQGYRDNIVVYADLTRTTK